MDQNAQKQHWPLQEIVQKIRSNELAAYRRMAFRAIASTLLRGGDHLTAARFRRLREILDAGDDDPNDPDDPIGFEDELDMKMQSSAGSGFPQDWGAERLWAYPGMTQFMLKEWDAIRAEKDPPGTLPARRHERIRQSTRKDRHCVRPGCASRCG